MKRYEIGRHTLAVADADDPAVKAELLGHQGADVAVIDPPFEAQDKWRQHIMDPCVVFGQMRHMLALADWPFRFERVIVKARGHRSATVQVVHQHAFVAQVGSDRVLPRDARSYPSVVYQSPGADDQEKPLSLVMDHLSRWLGDWDVVWDPYAGSGVTMLAAELLGKRCVACEIDPVKALAIVERMNQRLLPGVLA